MESSRTKVGPNFQLKITIGLNFVTFTEARTQIMRIASDFYVRFVCGD